MRTCVMWPAALMALAAFAAGAVPQPPRDRSGRLVRTEARTVAPRNRSSHFPSTARRGRDQITLSRGSIKKDPSGIEARSPSVHRTGTGDRRAA